jgi:hypothetical protein
MDIFAGDAFHVDLLWFVVARLSDYVPPPSRVKDNFYLFRRNTILFASHKQKPALALGFGHFGHAVMREARIGLRPRKSVALLPSRLFLKQLSFRFPYFHNMTPYQP